MGGLTTLWGANAWSDALVPTKHHTFDSPFFAPLLETGIPQFGWGLYAFTVGTLRLSCLYINGRMPRGSSTARAIGAWFSFVFWAGLWAGSWFLPWNSTARVTYGAFMVFDLFGLIFAATDANVAFARAREVHSDGRT